jgi:RNase P/RNase MRP subunit p30
LKFADLLIEPYNEEEAIKMIKFLNKIGYNIIGLPSKFIKSEGILKLSNNLGINIVERVILTASNKEELFSLSKNVEKKAVLTVIPTNINMLRALGSIERVDLIRIPLMNNIKVDRSQRNLFRIRRSGAIEISLKEVLYNSNNIILWRRLKSVLRNALNLGIRLVLVSDAYNIFELWHPKQIISLFGSLYIERNNVIEWLTVNPSFVISNRYKV